MFAQQNEGRFATQKGVLYFTIAISTYIVFTFLTVLLLKVQKHVRRAPAPPAPPAAVPEEILVTLDVVIANLGRLRDQLQVRQPSLLSFATTAVIRFPANPNLTFLFPCCRCISIRKTPMPVPLGRC
jgi:hypothetical protein